MFWKLVLSLGLLSRVSSAWRNQKLQIKFQIKIAKKYQQEKLQTVTDSWIWNQITSLYTWGFIFWPLNNWLILLPLFFSTGRTVSHFLSLSVTHRNHNWMKQVSIHYQGLFKVILEKCRKSHSEMGTDSGCWRKLEASKSHLCDSISTQHLEIITLVRCVSDRGWIYPFTFNFSCQSISMKILCRVDFELGHLLLAAVCRIFAGRECVKRWTWRGRSVPTLFRAWGELRWLTAGVSWRNKVAQ